MLYFGEQLHWNPEIVDKFYYWEYEIYKEEYKKILEERKKEQDKQNESGGGDMNYKSIGNSMINDAKSSIKMPTIPKLI